LTRVRPLIFDVVRVALLALLVLQIDTGFCQGIKFEEVPPGKPLTRSNDYHLYWTGSLTAQIVSVQFRKNDLVVHEGPGFLKLGKYQIHLPGNLKLDTYTLVVLDPSTKAILQSDEIKIKRRIPLVGQIGLAMGIAIMISFITA